MNTVNTVNFLNTMSTMRMMNILRTLPKMGTPPAAPFNETICFVRVGQGLACPDPRSFGAEESPAAFLFPSFAVERKT